MIARLVLIATLVLLAAAPRSAFADGAPGPIAAELALADDAPAPSLDDALAAPCQVATPPPSPDGAPPRRADAALPPGPSLARVFRPPRRAA